MYKMKVNGVECFIPLIGEHAPQAAIQTVHGTKKTVKLMLKYSDVVFAGRVWRLPDTEVRENQQQEGSQDESEKVTVEMLNPEQTQPPSESTASRMKTEGNLTAQDEDAQKFKEGAAVSSTGASSGKGRSSRTAYSLEASKHAAMTVSKLTAHGGRHRTYYWPGQYGDVVQCRDLSQVSSVKRVTAEREWEIPGLWIFLINLGNVCISTGSLDLRRVLRDMTRF